MPLTICPDCERKISTNSNYCIYCGCPSILYRDGKTCPPDRFDNAGNILQSSEKNDPQTAQTTPRFLTIRETAKETGIAETAIRGMVYRNEIVFFRSGKKVYINYPRFLEYTAENHHA